MPGNLPDANALFWRQIERVLWTNIKGFIPFVKVLNADGEVIQLAADFVEEDGALFSGLDEDFEFLLDQDRLNTSL